MVIHVTQINKQKIMQSLRSSKGKTNKYLPNDQSSLQSVFSLFLMMLMMDLMERRMGRPTGRK